MLQFELHLFAYNRNASHMFIADTIDKAHYLIVVIIIFKLWQSFMILMM